MRVSFIIGLLIASTRAFHPVTRTTSVLQRITQLHSSLNLGSDVLVRPDDEDSPEFREYLKALLTLQANRAKTGHAAPSSASSDGNPYDSHSYYF